MGNKPLGFSKLKDFIIFEFGYKSKPLKLLKNVD
jgi:hypothetical protein